MARSNESIVACSFDVRGVILRSTLGDGADGVALGCGRTLKGVEAEVIGLAADSAIDSCVVDD